MTEDTPPIVESDTSSAPSHWGELRLRVVSGVIMASIALTVLWLGGGIFIAFVIMAAAQLIREWDAMCPDSARYKLFGMLYAALPCASIIWLRNNAYPEDDHGGLFLVLYVIVVVSATDIGAYFAGKRIGGPKLAPSISPGKTWAGLAGGVISAAIAGAVCASFTPYPPSLIACLDMGALLAIISQLGDLFESWLKRRAGVKDSGQLIPGHGGLMDRVDGMVFSLPIFAFCVWLYGSAAS